jgi:receptor protein-tyrosine kinase
LTDPHRTGRRSNENEPKLAEAIAKLAQDQVDSATARQFTYPVLQRGSNGVSRDVIAAYDPQSILVEPLRALRSQLALRWRQTSQRRALAIVSPDVDEGRSWLAANLATVFAQGGERTLLIDADLRNPCQHRLFNLDNSSGLSALLTGRAAIGDSVRRVHPELQLFILPAGPVPQSPQELLVCPEFASLLAALEQLFDVVVMDTPPASLTADAQIVASRAGAAVLLARRDHTRVTDLTTTMRGLTEAGAHVVGSIVNEH